MNWALAQDYGATGSDCHDAAGCQYRLWTPALGHDVGVRIILVILGFSFYVIIRCLAPWSLVYEVQPVFEATAPSLLFMGVAFYILKRRR